MTPLLPEDLTESFLRRIRKQFYPGRDKQFFQERRMLLQALTEPAGYLEARGVRLNSERYQVILNRIVHTINEHGNLARLRSPGRYLLHAVQEHLKHHGEEYYEAAKATRNAIDDIMAGLKPRTRGALQPQDNTVPELAAVHRILTAKKGPARKPLATPVQEDLFSLAKPKDRKKT